MWITETELRPGAWFRTRVIGEPMHGWDTKAKAEQSAKQMVGKVRVRATHEVDLYDESGQRVRDP